MHQPGTDLINEININTGIELSPGLTLEELRLALAMHINRLIKNDFQKLIYLLYRVDVSEQKLTTILGRNQGADACEIIATLLIERQLQKIESRRQYKMPDNDIDEAERW